MDCPHKGSVMRKAFDVIIGYNAIPMIYGDHEVSPGSLEIHKGTPEA